MAKRWSNGEIEPVADVLEYPEPSPGLLCLDALHPQVRVLVEALLAHETTLARHRAGAVHLRYHRNVVKVSLELVL
jgi:hypothetical protein